MISKFCYYNDEQKPIRVRILDQRYDAATATGDIYATVETCELRVFDVHMPEGHILYMKRWPNMLMISHIDPAALAQLQSRPPSEDAA